MTAHIEEANDDTTVEERYRKIFQHTNDGVMIVDLETERFIDVNPAACELLGYSRGELLSMHPEDIHPDDIDRIRAEFITQVVESGTGFTDELTCLTKSGETVPTEISGAALNPADENGEPTQMVTMLRDISERVANREALEEKVERLDRFAGIVSHDLRNPLGVIKGYTKLVRETWNGLDTRSATLRVESSCTLDADPTRLREALENVFENALEHAGPTVTVRVGSLEETNRKGFYIEDDGPGIPESEREAVLEWGHSTTTEGTGFGLAIVDSIIEAHGWEIEVRESESGGARFEITGLERDEHPDK